MSALGGQQQALLAALWQPRHADAIDSLALYAGPMETARQKQAERGLKAYRANAVELAQRALGGAFPVLALLLGEDNFGALARSFWQRKPPMRGDLAQWGEALPEQIESLPDLRDQEPYLADVARVEWALHAAATAADGRSDAASFSLLAQCDPADITLTLGPGVAGLASAYPVVSVIAAHLEGEPSLEQAGQRLRDGVGETALVWRQGFKPMLRHAAAGEMAFIVALQGKASLLDSLAAAPQIDFIDWLVAAVKRGLLVAATKL